MSAYGEMVTCRFPPVLLKLGCDKDTMSTKLILFITIHLGALVYFVELMRRVLLRSREYDLKEARTTLPFGFIRLRHIIIAYILTYFIWIIGSFFLYYYFIDPPLPTTSAPAPAFNLNY